MMAPPDRDHRALRSASIFSTSPLAPTAFAADGLIESVEAKDDQYLVGVQWHPEELAERDERMRRLFISFVAESTRTGA